MENEPQIALQRLEILQLADSLGSVSEACRRAGISRTQFYDLKRRFESHGTAGLATRASRSPFEAGSDEIETAVVALSDEHPTWGSGRLSEALNARGINWSGQIVQRFLTRIGLSTVSDRVRRLERLTFEGRLSPSPEQAAAIAKLNPAFKERDLRGKNLGQLLCQDTISFGVIPGLGPIFAQVIIDTCNSFAFGYVHLEKMPEHAALVLHHDVIPQYRRWGVKIREVITDRGREFCGPETHPYELYLSLHNIEHKVSPSPRLASNGFVERFVAAAEHEFFRPAAGAREPWMLELLQEAFLYWITKYNYESPLDGFPNMGKPPAQVCVETAASSRTLGRMPLDEALDKP